MADVSIENISERPPMHIVSDGHDAFMHQLRELWAKGTGDVSITTTPLSLKVHRLTLITLIQTLSPQVLYNDVNAEKRKIQSELPANTDAKAKYIDMLEFVIRLLVEMDGKRIFNGLRSMEESLNDTQWLEARAHTKRSAIGHSMLERKAFERLESDMFSDHRCRQHLEARLRGIEKLLAAAEEAKEVEARRVVDRAASEQGVRLSG